MKYINFKRFKFSTIFKNINFKRYERILAHVAEFVIFIIEYVFSRIYKSFNFIRHHLLKTYNNINFKKYNFSKIYRYLNIKKYKYVPVYIAGTVIFAAFIYLNIPMFFNYDNFYFRLFSKKLFNYLNNSELFNKIAVRYADRGLEI